MDIATISQLGILFVLFAFAATFLMYHLWGYPFDKATQKSEAPRSLMITHRVLGYMYLACYVLLMSQMLPRMWEYQVEFPARTVAHICLGFTIGFLLMIKISIMRFFRHFEEWMPYLGTSLLFCTVLLLGLSLPAAIQEQALASKAFSQESRERVARLLPGAGLPKDAPIAELATTSSLRDGRRVLLRKCVRCHDLKTVLKKPRTPSDWYRTVTRMVDKPALFDPISEDEVLKVTAYMVAITPELQRSRKRQRQAELEKDAAAKAAAETRAAEAGAEGMVPKSFDLAESKAFFEATCSQCHSLDEVDNKPPSSRVDIDVLIDRMIQNDLKLDKPQIEQIKWYLEQKFVNGK